MEFCYQGDPYVQGVKRSLFMLNVKRKQETRDPGEVGEMGKCRLKRGRAAAVGGFRETMLSSTFGTRTERC